MAQQDVNNIVQAFQSFIESRQRDAQLAQQKSTEDARTKIEQQRADQEEKDRADRSKQFQQNLKIREQELDANRQMQDANRTLLMQKATENILNGVPVAGDVTAPGAIDPSTGLSSEMMHEIPGFGPNGTSAHVTLPTPDAYAQQVAQRQRIVNAPVEEAKTREQAAAQEAETTRQLKLAATEHANRLAEESGRQAFELKRQNQLLAAQKAERAASDANALRRTVFETTGGLTDIGAPGSTISTSVEGGPPQVRTGDTATFVNNTIDQIRNGQITTEDLNKKYGNKRAQYLQGLANQSGYTTLSKDQKSQLDDLERVAQVVPTLHSLTSLTMSNPDLTMIPLTKENKNYNNLKDMVQRNIPAIVRVLSGTKRYNESEAEKIAQSLIPSRGPNSGDLNFNKLKDFINKDLENAYQNVVKDLSPSQQATIRNRIGLNNMPYLGSAMQQSTSPAPGRMNVIIRKTGKPGSIPVNEFDTNLYQMVGSGGK